MNKRISDYISYTRIIVVVIFSGIICLYPKFFGIWGILIIIIIFVADSIDGYFARKFDKPDPSGAFLDIASDRVTESILLVPFVLFDVAHPFLLIYFITRGFVIDFIRLKKYMSGGEVPFKQESNKFFFLVKSRFMRALIGTLKVLMICLFYFKLINVLDISQTLLTWISIATIVVSLLRTIPVFFSI